MKVADGLDQPRPYRSPAQLLITVLLASANELLGTNPKLGSQLGSHASALLARSLRRSCAVMSSALLVDSPFGVTIADADGSPTSARRKKNLSECPAASNLNATAASVASQIIVPTPSVATGLAQASQP